MYDKDRVCWNDLHSPDVAVLPPGLKNPSHKSPSALHPKLWRKLSDQQHKRPV